MSLWNVPQADIDDYIATMPDATLNGTDENKFRLICTQMWLACTLNFIEAYNLVRRTGYPVIPVRTGTETPYPLTKCTTNGYLPRRVQYPSKETKTNKVNYDAALAVQGADTRLTQMWWDTKTLPLK